MQFELVYTRVFTTEGSFTKNQDDPGNWTGGKVGVGLLKGTKGGIAAATYPDLDIEHLTNAQIKDIYYNDWWIGKGMQRFSSAMQYQMFDAAFNHGMHNAATFLQQAAEVKADGNIGPVTLAKVATMTENDMLLRFLGYRLKFYTSLSTFAKFGRGWSNRVADNLLYAAMDN